MKAGNHLIEGPIDAGYISAEIQKHETKSDLGAHALFIGTVRADLADEKTVTGIEYTAYEDMIAAVISEIKDELFKTCSDLKCLHIYHSTGWVRAGENSLFVMASSGHRKEAFLACSQAVELIKEKLPVWKKEVFDDGSSQWLEH
jgi:molybdopterin synthase catalytic subunit